MLTQLAKAEGKITPGTALASRPTLTPWQQRFMDAFNTLSSSRNYTSASASVIPYPYILKWLDEHLIFDVSDREESVLIIQAMDSTYLQEVLKKSPK